MLAFLQLCEVPEPFPHTQTAVQPLRAAALRFHRDPHWEPAAAAPVGGAVTPESTTVSAGTSGLEGERFLVLAVGLCPAGVSLWGAQVSAGQRALSPQSALKAGMEEELGLFLILPQLWTLTLTRDDCPWRGTRLGGHRGWMDAGFGESLQDRSAPSAPPSPSPPVPAEMSDWEKGPERWNGTRGGTFMSKSGV